MANEASTKRCLCHNLTGKSHNLWAVKTQDFKNSSLGTRPKTPHANLFRPKLPPTVEPHVASLSHDYITLCLRFPNVSVKVKKVWQHRTWSPSAPISVFKIEIFSTTLLIFNSFLSTQNLNKRIPGKKLKKLENQERKTSLSSCSVEVILFFFFFELSKGLWNEPMWSLSLILHKRGNQKYPDLNISSFAQTIILFLNRNFLEGCFKEEKLRNLGLNPFELDAGNIRRGEKIKCLAAKLDLDFPWTVLCSCFYWAFSDCLLNGITIITHFDQSMPCFHLFCSF